MPKSWQASERLAGVLAYIEVSEQGGNVDLNNAVAKAYPKHLVDVHVNYGQFVETKHKVKDKGGIYTYTKEESAIRRPYSSVNAMINNFIETRKEATSFITPAYLQVMNKDGSVPTGTDLEKMLLLVKQKYYDSIHVRVGVETRTSPKKPKTKAHTVDDTPRGVGEDEDGYDEKSPDGGGAVEDASSMPENWDGGQFFLTWVVLGPLGKINNVHFMAPSPSSGKKEDGGNGAKAKKPTSREKLRQNQYEAKQEQLLNRSTGQSLAKLVKHEKHANTLRAAHLTLEKRKHAETEFDGKVARLEKRISLTKDKVKKGALETELDELLQVGPEQVAPVIISDSDDDQDEDEDEKGRSEAEAEAAEEEEEKERERAKKQEGHSHD